MTTENNKKNIDELLAEIGRASLISAEEELALIKAIQEKGPECEEMEKLIEPNMRFVVSVAAQYQNQSNKKVFFTPSLNNGDYALTIFDLSSSQTNSLIQSMTKHFHLSPNQQEPLALAA